ncbi:UNVERIFIED_CONTAM: Retrovirus-related Pol polyprotein from transposon TNT 1-94 [Sesamum radiatum]|uniref:Retrovirus-related Pol polyprotein from transposon TNT 1-94 n=1 Tax=Sesamum radiatum TaxID=300843 RepID=A0AAW2K9Y1_SESRA
MMNQEFVKLNCFDGTNYPRWKDKMMFLLTFLKIAYVLDINQPATEPKEGDTDEIKATRIKRGEDELLCRGHILNAFSDHLFDLYSSIKSPLKIWNALEQKYNNKKQGTDKFLTMKYFEFAMRDGVSIMDQVHEMQIYVSKLKDLKIEIPKAIQVGAIIAKLPLSWNNYRDKLLHSTKDFSVDQLLKHLRIEEETRIRDKMFQVQPNSKVNFVSEKNKNTNPSGVGNKRKSFDSDSNKRHVTCYNCGKKGHIKKDCRFRKKQKKEEIRKNLVSAAILSKKGLNTVIEADKLIVTKNGEFVGKGYYCDGMFKLCDRNIVLNKIPILLTIEGDPKTFIETMTSRDVAFWKEAVNDEMDSLLANNTWVLTDLPPGSKATGSISTPYDVSCLLVENAGRTIAQLEYASAIGSLMYAMHCTRLDIAFAVCKLSRFTNNPSIEHWKGIRRVFGYLKGTVNLGLFYNRFPAVLECYSDASWITSVGNNKSTSGCVFTLAGGAVAWASKKQMCSTHSTMEAEFVALAAANKEAKWPRNLLLDIKLWPQPIPAISLLCDSETAMSRALNKLYKGKNKHINLRHGYIRDLISEGVITITFVRSQKNLADLLTKGMKGLHLSEHKEWCRF